MLNSESSPELDKQSQTVAPTTERVKMAATDAGSPRRLGLNLNLSVQPHTAAYHWPHSTVGDDASPPSRRSKGCTDDEDDDRDTMMDEDDEDDRDDGMGCRQDEDCSPEDEQDILEMQREERETLNQLARQLASGSRLMAPMLQHLVYQHPGLSVQQSSVHHSSHHQQHLLPLQPPSSLAANCRQLAATDLSPKSSRSGDSPPMSGGRQADVHSPSSSRNNEAQSWTFEEQFRQLYSAGNETDRRSFLDSLFSFMQEQGTPISRLPIMAKRVLDLYTLYKLVVQRGGIVAVITKKLWQEIIRGLGLPPSITSAAFTLRTQYVKYLYAYESRMNQFSTLDELNMAIAGNRREGRRNKSLMYSDMPPPALGHHNHQSQHHSHIQHHQQQQMHNNQMHHQGHPPTSQPLQQQPPPPPPPPMPESHHHQHYANVLAAEDRFRHLAAAIIDNHHHAAAAAAAAAASADHPRLRQSCSPPQQQQHIMQHQQQQDCKPSRGSPVPPSSLLFNGQRQPSSYQHAIHQHQHLQQSDALQSTNEQTNKQRELLSMLMWMDIVRANQTVLPRLPITSLPNSPSAAAAAAAYTAAAALNLTPAYKGPIAQAVAVPEQSEALNLGKKRTLNNNNNGDVDDGDVSVPDRVENDRGNGENDQDEDVTASREKTTTAPSSAKRIKTERSSPPNSNCSSDDETAVKNGILPPQTIADIVQYRSDSTIRDNSLSPIADDVVEMDINTSPSAGSSGNSCLSICVTRRTKNGVFTGQLTKDNALVNGGLNNNANSFVLHLNGDLYAGHLQLQ